MRRAMLLARTGLEHQAAWAKAFAAGLARHGWRTEIVSSFSPADLLVIWGVRRQDEIARQKAVGGAVCVLERGYVGDRMRWTSVSFGGALNGRAEFRGPFADPTRWEQHHGHLLRPWRAPGGAYALLCGQVEGDSSLRGVDIHAWYLRTTQALEARGHRVRFRPHPLASRSRRAPPPLAEDLAGAAFAVTFNSNAAVDAVLAGVPTIATDRGSMAWDVTGHEIAPPPAPDRTAWAHRLAWCQYTKEEMASGVCWDAVGRERVLA